MTEPTLTEAKIRELLLQLVELQQTQQEQIDQQSGQLQEIYNLHMKLAERLIDLSALLKPLLEEPEEEASGPGLGETLASISSTLERLEAKVNRVGQYSEKLVQRFGV